LTVACIRDEAFEAGRNRHRNIDQRDVRLPRQDRPDSLPTPIESSAHPEAATGEFLRDQTCGFAVITDAEHVRAG
jgi:hypothetical protein